MTNTDMTAQERYAAALPNMEHAGLLDELESCVRQNQHGSHNEQIRMLRNAILRRMSFLA